MSIYDNTIVAPHSRTRPLRVTMLGLRGFPHVQGGVETHVENLSAELVRLGCEVEAIVRSPYMAHVKDRSWRNVALRRIWSPRIQGVEALLHTLFGIVVAAFTRPDILHIHSIGPGLFAPLARLFGLRVVLTHHVLNFENEKWGPLARGLLRLSERIGLRFSNARIAVSEALGGRVNAFGLDVNVIPNGIKPPQMGASLERLRALGLAPHRYVLTVARLDPQKRQLDLIAAFRAAKQAGWKLALVGGADHANPYAAEVLRQAENDADIVVLGHRSGAELAALFEGAGLFVLPSSHEGQPIATLEAIGYGLPVVLSDIAAHREIGLAGARYVRPGDVEGLTRQLQAAMADVFSPLQDAERQRILARHDWRAISKATLDVYRSVTR